MTRWAGTDGVNSASYFIHVFTVEKAGWRKNGSVPGLVSDVKVKK